MQIETSGRPEEGALIAWGRWRTPFSHSCWHPISERKRLAVEVAAQRDGKKLEHRRRHVEDVAPAHSSTLLDARVDAPQPDMGRVLAGARKVPGSRRLRNSAYSRRRDARDHPVFPELDDQVGQVRVMPVAEYGVGSHHLNHDRIARFGVTQGLELALQVLADRVVLCVRLDRSKRITPSDVE